ncbi:GDP-fucose synthetase [Pandoraea captiosa]|uniref:GDP-L-fucose synthase n=1 Tax=Pandoraea captiosa TaxID=2508302 RepID=A0A5E5AEA9_9BURK|nr:GDP-L-fucose synthase [Pandoraea captiosa]VVE70843.1 GDP-fucose synthetase [Pandoraea captiosa]
MAKGRILLTGARGMVGRNLLDHPAASEWEFIAPASAELDLTDFDAVSKFMREARPDVVVHAAGRVGGIQANIANPVDFFWINTVLGRNVVIAARDAGVKRLLNLGSSCMYPRNAPNPLAEPQILQGELEPTNEGYALAKIATQRLCAYVHQEDASFDYKTFVPCNLYGPYDKFDPAKSHLIPAIIHKVHMAKAQGDSEIEIWGDGTARREFMYAGDLADSIMMAVEKWEDTPALLNIGVGADHSVNDYYASVARVIGWQGTFVHDLSRPAGMKQKLLDVTRQTAWGWQPKVSLDEGIARTYEFYLRKGLA